MGVAANWRVAADEYFKRIRAALVRGLDAPGSAQAEVDAIVRDLHRYAETQVPPSARRAFVRRCGLKVARGGRQ